MDGNAIYKSTDISAFFGLSDSEKKSIVVEHITHNALVFVHFGLVVAGYLPLWSFWIGVLIYIPRWMITLHELQHFWTPKTINLITRYNLLVLTPFQLGYCEMRDIHMRHHAYTATEKDPEYYHIRGSSISGFLNVMFSPEQSVYFWIRDKGIDAELLKGMLVRLVAFVALIWSSGWMSVWYFIPVRLTYGSCLFFFSYWLHREKGAYGTFRVNYPCVLKKIMMFCYGKLLFNGVSEHDIHHDYPRVAGSKLADARPYYQPKMADKSI